MNFTKDQKITITVKQAKVEDTDLDNMLLEKSNVAKIRRIGMESIQRQHHSTSLRRWDNYRVDKVELVRNYIAVLKSKKRVKRWIDTMQA